MRMRVPVRDALESEFHETYDQVRARDDHIVSVAIVYLTVVLLAGLVSVALLQLQGNTRALALVGMVLIGASIVGFPILNWLIFFRRSFVHSVRHLCHLRSSLVYDSSEDDDESPSGVDVLNSDYWNPDSAHLATIVLASFVNAGFAGGGAAVFAREQLISGIPALGAFALVGCAVCSVCLIWAALNLSGD